LRHVHYEHLTAHAPRGLKDCRLHILATSIRAAYRNKAIVHDIVNLVRLLGDKMFDTSVVAQLLYHNHVPRMHNKTWHYDGTLYTV